MSHVEVKCACCEKAAKARDAGAFVIVPEGWTTRAGKDGKPEHHCKECAPKEHQP